MSEFNPDFFIFTRLGVGVKDPLWFETRLKFFEAVTASSIFRQSYGNFKWIIFVGEEPLECVLEKLKNITSNFGERVIIVKTVQSRKAINEVIAQNRTSKFLITALMDDDDAWDRSLLETVVNDSHKFYSAGIERVGFTYPHGFEWLYTDLIDIDALQKGEKIIRKAGCYQYFYPFLTMTSFTFSVNEQNLGFIVAVHSSKGEILNDNNFRKVVIDSEFPAWLYFRHQQADSAIHKAHQLPEVNISTEEICKKFGLNYELISKIQSKAHEIPYAKKRVLGEPDKSSLLLNVSADETYHHIVKKRVDNGKFVFEVGKDVPRDMAYRVCFYDDVTKSYLMLKEAEANTGIEVLVSEFPKEAMLRFKIQKKVGNRWSDFIPFTGLDVAH